MPEIQLTGLSLDEPSLTLWHYGRVRVDESAIVVADGVPEMEIATGAWVAAIRPIRRGFHSGVGIILCKGKHGIATEVRNTNLRFSVIITTPTSHCQRRSDGSQDDQIRARRLSMEQS